MMVFCDNYGCVFIDECGFCDCDKLSIVGGVCEGSYHSGRNADDKSRWHELFGTPELAAHTSWYMLMCKYMDCHDCPIADGCDMVTDIDCDDGEAALLEWLRGDAQ